MSSVASVGNYAAAPYLELVVLDSPRVNLNAKITNIHNRCFGFAQDSWQRCALLGIGSVTSLTGIAVFITGIALREPTLFVVGAVVLTIPGVGVIVSRVCCGSETE